MSELAGRRALVTGGSKGIGLAIAEAFIDEGIDVAVSARSSDDVSHAAEALNQRGGGRAAGPVVDVRDPAACQAILGAALS